MALLILAVFGWVVCIALAYDFARAKGNDTILAAFLGLLFGPLGLLIVGLMPANESALALRRRSWTIQQIQTGRLIECPHCRSAIPPARVCRVCGRETGKACPQCNAFNPPDYSFCGNCGNRFGKEILTQGKEILTI